MEANYEYLLFTQELRRLQRDYQRCHDLSLKQEIYNDIKLLECALNAYN